MTETQQRPDRRALRHAATKQEIVEAAWGLARERGLGGWALRDVAEAVGMRTPSLYVYFASKTALFDAVFAGGCTALLGGTAAAVVEIREKGLSSADVLHGAAVLFFDFCVEDQARYQLLFLRTIPGFEPSPESYALAREALDAGARVLAEAGAGGQERLDLWTAL